MSRTVANLSLNRLALKMVSLVITLRYLTTMASFIKAVVVVVVVVVMVVVMVMIINVPSEKE